METALAFCQRLVDWPRASIITPSRRHWELFAGLCRAIKGPLVADAYIAALAIEHGCELVTTDVETGDTTLLTETAHRLRDGYLFWLTGAPGLDPLRADPRFATLVRRVGLAAA